MSRVIRSRRGAAIGSERNCREPLITGHSGDFDASHIEPEQDHVPVLHLVIFSFAAHLPGRFRGLLAAEGDVVVVGDRLGADEAALEIAVDLARPPAALSSRAGSSRRALPSVRR